MDTFWFNFFFELIKPLILWFVVLPTGLLFLAYLIFILVESIRERKKNNRGI